MTHTTYWHAVNSQSCVLLCRMATKQELFYYQLICQLFSPIPSNCLDFPSNPQKTKVDAKQGHLPFLTILTIYGKPTTGRCQGYHMSIRWEKHPWKQCIVVLKWHSAFSKRPFIDRSQPQGWVSSFPPQASPASPELPLPLWWRGLAVLGLRLA